MNFSAVVIAERKAQGKLARAVRSWGNGKTKAEDVRQAFLEWVALAELLEERTKA